MLIDELNNQFAPDILGELLHATVRDLFPICRSITGEGVRETLAYLKQHIPLDQIEVPSGTSVLDWTIPKEWRIRDAYFKDPSGNKVVDFKQSNLHVLNYSTPFAGTISLDALKSHLFTLPVQPDWVPYRTSYYNENWGFCLSQNKLDALPDGDYEVLIDAELFDGYLSYGECYLPGESTDEVLISCHICHPSLANDNLSGLAVAMQLVKLLSRQQRRYSYRFLFIPGTIGAITWLARNEASLGTIKHGLVLAGIGDAGELSYKQTRQGHCEIDEAVAYVLRQQAKHRILPFSPYGYDERQYGSPGFNLPVGRLSRTPHGEFVEYHTSADNLDFVKPAQLAKSLQTCTEIVDVLENNNTFINVETKR